MQAVFISLSLSLSVCLSVFLSFRPSVCLCLSVISAADGGGASALRSASLRVRNCGRGLGSAATRCISSSISCAGGGGGREGAVPQAATLQRHLELEEAGTVIINPR